MKSSPIFLFFLLLLACPPCAAGDIPHRERVRAGIKAIYDLDYDAAQRIFDQVKKDDPESPIGYGMAAITAWHRLLFSARNPAVFEYGIPTPFGRAPVPSESIPPEEKRFLDANQELQDVCDKLLKENPQNALALYFKGVAYENLATQVLTIDRKSLLSSRHAKTAGKLHREALELDPGLIDAKTSTAVQEYVVGSFNITLRWLALLLGIRGDKKGAAAKLEQVAGGGMFRATDSMVVLALLEAWKGDAKRAVSLFGSIRAQHPRNFLSDISLAAVYEQAAKDAKSAIRIYEELLRDMPAKAPGIHPGEIHFRIGKDYAMLGDYNTALDHFKQALSGSQGNAETRPLAYYEMALIHEKRGDKTQAKECYGQVANHSGPPGLIEKEIAQARKKMGSYR